MTQTQEHRFSGPITVFHGKRLPERATPAGYAALIDAYRLSVPLPRTLSAIGERHRVTEGGGWRVLTPRHAPEATLEGHLTFALKYEGLDLVVLKRLFLAVGPSDMETFIRATPTGSYSRRLWFLFEWLTGKELNVPAADKGTYVTAIDTDLQYAADGQNSSRHRVRNNMPGTSEFCPLISRTPKLDEFIGMELSARARAIINKMPRELLARTEAFLLLKDSKASYVIEGESPPQDRIQRWGVAIGEAGKAPLDLEELLRLQRIVIGNERFVHLGLRKEGGFVGEHDHAQRTPIPDHISARPEDLASLVQGMAGFDNGADGSLEAVLAAAALAFGFVYIHPFQDGNGRIHRYLIHHVLARRGFAPPGVNFPVSAAILERIMEYREALESYSRRLLPLVEWEPTSDGNLRVLNDTADFYRFFDATPHAEFLYGCVQQTVEQDLPNETRFLERFDRFRAGVQQIVDMPDRTLDNLLGFLRQNEGHLSKRARENEFKALTPAEVERVEELYAAEFGEDEHVED